MYRAGRPEEMGCVKSVDLDRAGFLRYNRDDSIAVLRDGNFVAAGPGSTNTLSSNA